MVSVFHFAVGSITSNVTTFSSNDVLHNFYFYNMFFRIH